MPFIELSLHRVQFNALVISWQNQKNNLSAIYLKKY
jgi:hypothetical protein